MSPGSLLPAVSAPQKGGLNGRDLSVCKWPNDQWLNVVPTTCGGVLLATLACSWRRFPTVTSKTFEWHTPADFKYYPMIHDKGSIGTGDRGGGDNHHTSSDNYSETGMPPNLVDWRQWDSPGFPLRLFLIRKCVGA